MGSSVEPILITAQAAAHHILTVPHVERHQYVVLVEGVRQGKLREQVPVP